MLIFIVGTGMVLGALVVWFHSLESKSNRHVIAVVLLFTLLVEALLAGPASEVPIGILRPRVFGQDFRPPDAVIFAALAARTLSVSRERMSALTLPWLGFIAVYVTGVLVGILSGLPATEVLFQGKGSFYLVGGAVIAAGLDCRRLAVAVGKVGVYVAVLVPVALVIESFNVNLSVATPVQRFNRLGRLSNDTVTLITLLGVVVFVTEATRPGRRLKVGIAGLVLLLAPAAGHQRASYLVLAVMAAGLMVLAFGTTWRKRATVTAVEMSLVGIGMSGLVMLGFAITSEPGVIIAPVQDAFGGEAEERSASARFSLVDQALSKIQESPVIGSGVGTKVIRKAELSNREVEAAAHNIVLDITMRVGFVGLFLFLFAVWSTWRWGTRVWRTADDDAVAAIAIAGVLVMLGVITKGMVEPAIDKFRLSLTMGIGVGMVVAALRAHEATARRRPVRAGADTQEDVRS